MQHVFLLKGVMFRFQGSFRESTCLVFVFTHVFFNDNDVLMGVSDEFEDQTAFLEPKCEDISFERRYFFNVDQYPSSMRLLCKTVFFEVLCIKLQFYLHLR